MKDIKVSHDAEDNVLSMNSNTNPGLESCFHTVLKLATETAQYSEIDLTGLPSVLIDADILLDVLLGRPSKFFKDMKKVLKLVFSREIHAYVSESGLQRVWSLARQLKGNKNANYLLFNLVRYFSICALDLESMKKGFEYSSIRVSVGLQVERAKKIDASLIISSSDIEEFAKCGYAKTFSPSSFLQKWSYEHRERADDYEASISNYSDSSTIAEKWKVEDFNLASSKGSNVNAHVTLLNVEKENKRVFGSASSSSSVEAILDALDDAVSDALGALAYERVSIKILDIEGHAGSSVVASAVVKAGAVKVQKHHSSPDSIQACFYAYVKAVGEIIAFINESHAINLEETVDVEVEGAKFQISQDLKEQYNNHKIRDFNNRNFRDSNFDECDFSDASFRECDFSLSYMRHIILKEANLEGAVLKDVHLSYADISNANLERANLTGSKLDKANLKDANLSKADLSRCYLEGTSLEGANLSRANLDKGVAHRANLSNVNLSQASLQYVDLSNANLRKANLTGADLTSAKLETADLTGANLAGAILKNVDFSSVIIDGANLSGADLKSANLSNLDIKKVVFCKPSLLDTVMPQVKFEIYGSARSETVIELLSQIDSDHYQISAVHHDPLGTWWSSSIGKSLLNTSSLISSKGVDIKRLFIIPHSSPMDQMQSTLCAHIEAGIAVKTISEELVDSKGIHPCSDRNFLVCKNKRVPANSFVTMMISDKDGRESSGYISYRVNDLKMYEETFDILWKDACGPDAIQESGMVQCSV